MQKLTCLIPLYRSKQFRSIVLKNIKEHLQSNIRVIVSDRHVKDDLIDQIDALYKDSPLLLTVKKTDEGDWVDNINGMIEMVETDYFRILPHDDSTSAKSSHLLVDALEWDKRAIVATGVVKAKNLLGIRLPGRDELNLKERSHIKEWTISDCMEFYWKGSFAGSFKGAIRTNPVQDARIYIEKTPSLVHSERTWLFALTLLGKFIVVPESVLIKRYYKTSTHKKWVYSDKTTFNATQVMAAYCDRLIEDSNLLNQLKFNLYHNALNSLRPVHGDAVYDPLLPNIQE